MSSFFLKEHHPIKVDLHPNSRRLISVPLLRVRGIPCHGRGEFRSGDNMVRLLQTYRLSAQATVQRLDAMSNRSY